MENFSENLLVAELKELCIANAESYQKDDSEYGHRMRLGFLSIVDQVNSILPLVADIEKIMQLYDFDENIPGNGYRSFVVIAQASFKHAIQLCKYVALNKDSLIFRKGVYTKEVEAISHMIASLTSCFNHLNTLLNWSSEGELFPSSDHYSELLLKQSDNINQYAFYGRCLGIQFCSSIQPLLKIISIFMASFSEIYFNIGSFSAKAQGFFSGGKFLLDPELRAQRIVNISQHADIGFCKAFWFLTESELMKKIPDFVCSSVSVNTEIKVPPEPLQIKSNCGKLVDIPIPSSHIPVNSIQVRLLSSDRRDGMIAIFSDSNKKYNALPPSRSIIFHCHGGGFVAQSSKSHEVYLRDWARELNVPILSVDYSLAPEAPFPRAIEEVFYCYCWALKNCRILGWTGEKIILAGDSAGGNLVLGVALKCIQYNIQKANGLFLAYVPVIVSSTPSPSRLLCLMDPLLPLGFLLRCLKAYSCPEIEVVEKCLSAEEYYSINTKADDLNANPNGKIQSDKMEDDVSPSNAGSDDSLSSSDTIAKLYSMDSSVFEILAPEKKVLEVSTDSLQKLEEDERNYKNSFNTLKRVYNIVSKTLRLESKNIDKNLVDKSLENLNSGTSIKDFKFSVSKDPYLSPYWASDESLKALPPTSICTVEFDPCLDDCVMFAKKLKRLGNTVSLDVLKGLPHGFLNFSKVNKDAEEGSKICIGKIKELLSREEIK